MEVLWQLGGDSSLEEGGPPSPLPLLRYEGPFPSHHSPIHALEISSFLYNDRTKEDSSLEREYGEGSPCLESYCRNSDGLWLMSSKEEVTQFNIEAELLEHCEPCSSPEPSPLSTPDPQLLKAFFCHICNEPFTDFTQFSQHQLTHKTTTKFFCKKCDFSSEDSIALKVHKKSEHSKQKVVLGKSRTKVSIFCKECSYSCKYPKNLAKHIKQIHGVAEVLFCDSCDFTCQHLNSMRAHWTHNHREITRYKRLSCEDCPYTTNKKSHFQRHQLTHLKEKSVACSSCTFTCTTTCQLKRHVTAVHEEKKPPEIKLNNHRFICDECGRGFPVESKLKCHKRLHQKGNLFFCNECSYSCRCHKSLKRHSLIHSPGGLPVTNVPPPVGATHRCTLCPYATPQKHHLKRHLATHYKNAGRIGMKYKKRAQAKEMQEQTITDALTK